MREREKERERESVCVCREDSFFPLSPSLYLSFYAGDGRERGKWPASGGVGDGGGVFTDTNQSSLVLKVDRLGNLIVWLIT